MSDLADGTDLAKFLGLSPLPAVNSPVWIQLDDQVTAAITAFELDTHRTLAPFQDEQTGRKEIHDGIGQKYLLLDYQPRSVSAAIVGTDLANPTETLTVGDPAVVVWRKGDRRLWRMDGKRWHVGWKTPGWVQVTYNTLADLPEDVKQAVLQYAATLYHSLPISGSAGIQSESETLDNYSRSVTYANASVTEAAPEASLQWLSAVKRHKRLIAV